MAAAAGCSPRHRRTAGPDAPRYRGPISTCVSGSRATQRSRYALGSPLSAHWPRTWPRTPDPERRCAARSGAPPTAPLDAIPRGRADAPRGAGQHQRRPPAPRGTASAKSAARWLSWGDGGRRGSGCQRHFNSGVDQLLATRRPDGPATRAELRCPGGPRDANADSSALFLRYFGDSGAHVGGPRPGSLSDQVVALGDVRGQAGSLGVRSGGG